MKKYNIFFLGIIAIEFCIILSVSVLIRTKADYHFKGRGSLDSPYLVETAEDFLYLGEQIRDGELFSDVYFKQCADIDLSSYGEIDPIGDFEDDCPFFGIYDGNGHSISGYRINANGRSFAALFESVGGKVVNLVLEDGMVSGKKAAGIAGVLRHGGEIVNCCVYGTVEGDKAAGIAVAAVGDIDNCVSGAELRADKTDAVFLEGQSGRRGIVYSPADDKALDDLNFFVEIHNQRNLEKLCQWVQDGESLRLVPGD